MARTSSPLLLAATLAGGVALGLAAGQHVPSLTAQSSRPAPTATTPPTASVLRAPGDAALYAELDRQYALFAPIDQTFASVAQAVAPAVVHIVARKPALQGGRRREPHFLEETGSGVIVRPEGKSGLYVLTNNHVVEWADPAEVSITLHDGRALRPVQIWSDAKADIAVIELGRDDLPAARLGDSDALRVGNWVLALGSPFGLTHSVSQGIISARNRHEEELEDEGVENQEFLQTDAAINPGNSGGPLVNMRGEVVGINTAIASAGGGSEGVGFSIPINLARWIMTELVTRGHVQRGALGVRLQNVPAQRAVDLGLERPRGARILSVQVPSPAAEAGIRNDDVVLRYNGVDVLDINHLINLVSMTPIGQTVDVVLWRDNQTIATRVTIGSRDALVSPAPATTDSNSNSNSTPRRPTPPVPSPTGRSRP